MGGKLRRNNIIYTKHAINQAINRSGIKGLSEENAKHFLRTLLKGMYKKDERGGREIKFNTVARNTYKLYDGIHKLVYKKDNFEYIIITYINTTQDIKSGNLIHKIKTNEI